MRSEAKSKEFFERALKTLVGGVNSPVRSFKRVGGTPLFVSHAKEDKIWDIDGNMYVDFVMSYGPHLFGHAKKEIVEASKKAIENSSCFGFSSKEEVYWAEETLSFFSRPQMVRAMSTGTEATMTAVRLARGITGRDIIVKFSGHYHGHVDSLLVDAGSGVATLSEEAVPECKGVPKDLARLARVLPFNDVESAEQLFLIEGSKIAAVIVEPIMGNMGVIPPELNFLNQLRKLCTQYGALLILDEVMSGFRVGPQSAQGLYGIDPDLTCFGKIVGGGLPLSALVGSPELMKHLAPEGPVYQAGTLSGNPVAISAGRAMLELIKKEKPYEKLEKISSRFEAVLLNAAKVSDVSVSVQRVGSMISVFFRDKSAKNAEDARNINTKQFSTYFKSLLAEGILIPPSPFEAYFLSTEHEKTVFSDHFEESIHRVFQKVAKQT